MRVSKELVQECTGFHHHVYHAENLIIVLWRKDGENIELKYQSSDEYRKDRDFLRKYFRNTFE